MLNIYTHDRKFVGQLSDDTFLRLRGHRLLVRGEVQKTMESAPFTLTEALRIGPTPDEAVILLNKTFDIGPEGELMLDAEFEGADS